MTIRTIGQPALSPAIAQMGASVLVAPPPAPAPSRFASDVRVAAASPASSLQLPAPRVPGSDAPSAYPPGHGLVLGNPGAGTPAGARAMKQSGGVSYVSRSAFNSGREVSVHASPNFDPTKPYKVLVYAHGLDGGTANSMTDREHMAEAVDKLNKEGQNVLLVMPKGPDNDHIYGWMTGPHDDMDKLANEAISNFSKAAGYNLGEPSERLLMGHSAGGGLLANVYLGAHPPHFDKVLMADSSYGTSASRFVAGLDRYPGKKPQVAIVVTPGQTPGPANSQLAPRGVRVDRMPGVNHASTNPATHNDYPGHMGVPAYMAGAFLSGAPGSLTFSDVHSARRR